MSHNSHRVSHHIFKHVPLLKNKQHCCTEQSRIGHFYGWILTRSSTDPCHLRTCANPECHDQSLPVQPQDETTLKGHITRLVLVVEGQRELMILRNQLAKGQTLTSFTLPEIREIIVFCYQCSFMFGCSLGWSFEASLSHTDPTRPGGLHVYESVHKHEKLLDIWYVKYIYIYIYVYMYVCNTVYVCIYIYIYI